MAYFGQKYRIYDRIYTLCRMAESFWCNYAQMSALQDTHGSVAREKVFWGLRRPQKCMLW